MERIAWLKNKIETCPIWTPVNEFERELFELENGRVEEVSNEIVSANYSVPTNCKICKSRLIPIEGNLSCIDCGLVETIVYDPLNPGWSTTNQFQIVYGYSRIVNFREHLIRIQGLETRTIPSKLLYDVRRELNGRMTDKNGMLKILKKLKYKIYYINVFLILKIVCDVDPIEIPDKLTDRLLELFSKIQRPFNQSKPSKRNNFLNYRYTINKLLHIIGGDALNYVQYFPLLKQLDKNVIYDIIWKKICNICDFEFTPS